MPRFSIVVPHYDQSISDQVLVEGMESLAASQYSNFEVLLYHDGPISRPLPHLPEKLDIRFSATPARHNDWGHSLRDLGIAEAKGEYIIHFNPDNLLYPDALAQVARIDADIIICPVALEGTRRIGNRLSRTRDKADRVILDGFPPVPNNIDAMQLIMRTRLWRHYGGWSDKSERSDGKLYRAFCERHEPHYCGYLLGLHR